MPGGIPTATFAIGVPGAKNAALYAISILSADDDDLEAYALRPKAGTGLGHGKRVAEFGQRSRFPPFETFHGKWTQKRDRGCLFNRGMIEPGSTIGVLGGGQLGRMTGQAASTFGYGFVVYEPQSKSPAGHVADLEINAPYSDESALGRLADATDVVTYEFENVPVEATRVLEEKVRLHPCP